MIRNQDYPYTKIFQPLTDAYQKGSQQCNEHSCHMAICSGQVKNEPRLNRALTRSVVCLFALLTIFVNFVTAQENIADTKATTYSSPGYLHVEISNDLITVQAREVTIKDLLDRIAHQSCLIVILDGPLEERLTMELHGLPLPKAMRRILRNESFILQSVQPSSCTEKSNDVQLNKLWVFSKTAKIDHPSKVIVKKWVAPNANKTTAHWSVALTDADAGVRLDTASKLAIVGDDQAATALAAMALGDENASVREEAIYALGEIGNETVIQILAQALMDPDDRVREAAIDSYAIIGGDESAMALATTLNDETASLRAEAVDALGEIGGETAGRILQFALTDEENFIREAAAEYLAEFANQEW